MIKVENNKKGIILFIVLGTILIVTILANVIIGIMLSQSRLTHHQVSRIQAYYAAWGGVNLAYEKMRTGDPNWIVGTTHRPADPDWNDSNWPTAVRQDGFVVNIVSAGGPQCTPTPSGVQACIIATVDYTIR